jgi:hypothetical protein
MHKYVPLLATALTLAAPASAQLNLRLNFKFVDQQAGGNGNIGVTQDERSFHYYVIDFSNTNTVHEFDRSGSFVTQWPTSNCTPSAVSPNDIAYDSLTDHLWMVDNNGPVVIETDRAGMCISGWQFTAPSTNPVGLTYERSSDTLWMSSNGQVTQWSKQGTRLAGGFMFTPPAGGNILSGVTHDLRSDRFYIVNGGSNVFEVDKTGTLMSTTSLSADGVVNAQGIHFSVLLSQLVVVDNTLSTTFVYDLGACAGAIRARGQGCRDPQGSPLTMTWGGCPDLGKTLTLRMNASAANAMPVLFLVGTSDTMGFGGPLPLDLSPFGAPGCSIYTSSFLILPVPNPGGGAALPLAVPNDVTLRGNALHWQGLQASPLIPTPLPVITSDYLTTTFG